MAACVLKTEYDVDSWRLYRKEILESAAEYIPNPNEVARRAADLRWLQEMGFPEYFIIAVMWYEVPTIHEVASFLNRGVSKTEIIETFLDLQMEAIRRGEPF